MIHVGKRTWAYIQEHRIHTQSGGVIVADRYETPDGIRRTLTRVFGHPTTRDRGEVAYWDIDAGSEQIGQ